MIARGYVAAGAKVYVASRKREACEETAAELVEVRHLRADAGGSREAGRVHGARGRRSPRGSRASTSS